MVVVQAFPPNKAQKHKNKNKNIFKQIKIILFKKLNNFYVVINSNTYYK